MCIGTPHIPFQGTQHVGNLDIYNIKSNIVIIPRHKVGNTIHSILQNRDFKKITAIIEDENSEVICNNGFDHFRAKEYIIEKYCKEDIKKQLSTHIDNDSYKSNGINLKSIKKIFNKIGGKIANCKSFEKKGSNDLVKLKLKLKMAKCFENFLRELIKKNKLNEKELNFESRYTNKFRQSFLEHYFKEIRSQHAPESEIPLFQLNSKNYLEKSLNERCLRALAKANSDQKDSDSHSMRVMQVMHECINEIDWYNKYFCTHTEYDAINKIIDTSKLDDYFMLDFEKKINHEDLIKKRNNENNTKKNWFFNIYKVAKDFLSKIIHDLFIKSDAEPKKNNDWEITKELSNQAKNLSSIFSKIYANTMGLADENNNLDDKRTFECLFSNKNDISSKKYGIKEKTELRKCLSRYITILNDVSSFTKNEISDNILLTNKIPKHDSKHFPIKKANAQFITLLSLKAVANCIKEIGIDDAYKINEQISSLFQHISKDDNIDEKLSSIIKIPKDKNGNNISNLELISYHLDLLENYMKMFSDDIKAHQSNVQDIIEKKVQSLFKNKNNVH